MTLTQIVVVVFVLFFEVVLENVKTSSLFYECEKFMSFDQGKVVYHRDSFQRLHDP